MEVVDEHDDDVADEDCQELYGQLGHKIANAFGKLGKHQFGLHNAARSKTKESQQMMAASKPKDADADFVELIPGAKYDSQPLWFTAFDDSGIS